MADTYRIYNVSRTTGIVASVARTAAFNTSIVFNGIRKYSNLALAISGDGNIFIAADFRVRMVRALEKTIVTVAGNGSAGFTGDSVNATSTGISPTSIAQDANGNLTVVDASNLRMRQVSLDSGLIETIAGTGIRGFSGDGGPATQAQLFFPHAVALGPDVDIFISDVSWYSSRIRKVEGTSGIISSIPIHNDTYQLYGASINCLAVASNGDIFFTSNSSVWWLDGRNYTLPLRRLAGGANYGFRGNGGVASGALLYMPSGIALDPISGALYVADIMNGRMRKILLPQPTPTATRSPEPTSTITRTTWPTASHSLQVQPSRTATTTTSSTASPFFWGQAAVFRYTGRYQYFSVPAGVKSIRVHMWGAGGGGGYGHDAVGGAGAYVSGTLAVQPGETLRVIVGRGGTWPPIVGSEADGGGGGGWPTRVYDADHYGGGGGGLSGVQRDIGSGRFEYVAMAGGGGGGGGWNEAGGAAGILQGQCGGDLLPSRMWWDTPDVNLTSTSGGGGSQLGGGCGSYPGASGLPYQGGLGQAGLRNQCGGVCPSS